MDPTALFESIARWCLDHLPADPPCLVGVELGSHSMLVSRIELCPDDPVGDLGSLAAPDEWDLVVLTTATRASASTDRIRVAHLTSRDGQTFTEIRSFGGATRSIRDSTGRIAEVCRALFRPPERCGDTPRRRNSPHCHS